MSPLTYIHASEAARTTAGGGGVGGAELPPLKSATGAEKGAEAKCVHRARRSPTAGLLRALSRICIRFVFTSRKHIYNSPN